MRDVPARPQRDLPRALEVRRAALAGRVDLATIALHLTGEDGAVLADGRPPGVRRRAGGRVVSVLVWRLRARRAARPATPVGA